MREQVIQRLRQCGMGKNPIAQKGVGKVSHHGEFNHGHDFSTLDAENGGTENLSAVGVNNRLHESAALIDFQGACNVGHRHLRDANFLVPGASFGLGHTNAAKLWIDKNGVGNQASRGRSLALLDHVRADDAIVVEGNVRESWAAFDVAEHVDAASGCLQSIVCDDESVRICPDSGSGEIQRIGIRAAAGGNQQMGACDCLRPRLTLNVEANFSVAPAGAGGVCVQQNVDPILLEDVLDLLRDIAILSVQQLLAGLNDRDLASQATE